MVSSRSCTGVVEDLEVGGGGALVGDADGAGVGPDDDVGARHAAGGADLGVVLEQHEVGARAVRAEHRRQQPRRAVGGRGEPLRLGQAVGELRHCRPELVDQAFGTDLRHVGLRPPDHREPCRDARCRGVQGGQVDASVLRGERGRVQPGRDVQQGGQAVGGQIVQDGRDGTDRPQVVADERQVGADRPAEAVGLVVRGLRLDLQRRERALGGGHVGLLDLLLKLDEETGRGLQVALGPPALQSYQAHAEHQHHDQAAGRREDPLATADACLPACWSGCPPSLCPPHLLELDVRRRTGRLFRRCEGVPGRAAGRLDSLPEPGSLIG